MTLFGLAVIYRPLVMECVDPLFLRTVSRAGGPVHYAFLGLVVMNLVGGFQALGTLLAVGLMLLPAIAARFWARDLSGLIPVSMLIAVLSSVIGLNRVLPRRPADRAGDRAGGRRPLPRLDAGRPPRRPGLPPRQAAPPRGLTVRSADAAQRLNRLMIPAMIA